MNKKAKIIALILVAAMLSVLVIACGGSDSDSGAAQSGSDAANDVAEQGGNGFETIQSGRLIMATNAEFPPFEFINDDGDFDGFDVHLARAIADVLGLELVIDDMEFGAIIAAIDTGMVDIGIAAMSITEERLETVNFTTPYFETTIVVIVPEDSDITMIEDLEEARIAVQLGTTSDLIVEWELPDAQITRMNRAPETILELRAGRVDAIVIDVDVANQFINDNPDLIILNENLGYESYGMAVNKGNPALLAAINDALRQLNASGEYDRVFNMFFGGVD